MRSLSARARRLPAGDADAAEEEETALVRRVQGGDRDAFNALSRAHARRAFAIAYRILRHQQDAEDLVQDAFIAALTAIDTFDATRPFGPWFNRIVANRALNAVTARSTRERHAGAPGLGYTETERLEGSTDLGADAERTEVRERFERALADLTEPQRIVVQLSDVDGYSSIEIGDLLGMPPGTVRWHLHQGRSKLRLALANLRS